MDQLPSSYVQSHRNPNSQPMDLEYIKDKLKAMGQKYKSKPNFNSVAGMQSLKKYVQKNIIDLF